MPVTKTARRALRVTKRKTSANSIQRSALEVALRTARKTKKGSDVQKATSLADRASKKGLIHKNKASRIKESLSKLVG